MIDERELLGAPVFKGIGGFLYPEVETLAKLLCIVNRIPIVDPVDGSQNWWIFNDYATRMLVPVREPQPGGETNG